MKTIRNYGSDGWGFITPSGDLIAGYSSRESAVEAYHGWI
tara:strand:+ start:92 stop:211 length:120 start_codon:yes stop_codon:yes gene_type:complete